VPNLGDIPFICEAFPLDFTVFLLGAHLNAFGEMVIVPE
jgi:hypothetical protein